MQQGCPASRGPAGSIGIFAQKVQSYSYLRSCDLGYTMLLNMSFL
jgi:hypothetical protein